MSYQCDGHYIRFIIKLENILKNDKSTIFVIDHSGSMAGMPYEQVKAAIQYMEDNSAITQPDFILYNEGANISTSNEIVTNRAFGQTSFKAAFATLHDYIQQKPENSEITVVFMTDGQDTCSGKVDKGWRTFFKLYLLSCKRKVIIHALGFGNDCDRRFLEEICTWGTSQGVFRYAESHDLNLRFQELFDFLDITSNLSIDLAPNINMTFESEKQEDNTILIDELLPYNPQLAKFQEPEANIVINQKTYTLHREEPDIIFTLKRLDATEVKTQKDLEFVQKELSKVEVFKAPKATRSHAIELRHELQLKLDNMHQIFADIARGSINTGSGVAKLQSMRYDGKFSKSRRDRVMAMRAAKNVAHMQFADGLVAEHKLTDETPYKNYSQPFGSECSLSGDTILDIVKSPKDIMVFTLSIVRPEVVIDASTLILIKNIGCGTYSREVLEDSMKYAIDHRGADAKGGFAEYHGGAGAAAAVTGKVQEPPQPGWFRGQDGKSMNAYLPLFLDEDENGFHAKRVLYQLRGILGYFTTLDPLGYDSKQYFMLYSLLGQMLCMRANHLFNSEWADWLIQDFAKLCKAVHKTLMITLEAGAYANGKLRTHPLLTFITTPSARTKEIHQNLMTIIGYEKAFPAGEDMDKYLIAFHEELWRRAFQNEYKSEIIVNDLLQRLIFGNVSMDMNADGFNIDQERQIFEDNLLMELLTNGKGSLRKQIEELTLRGKISKDFCYASVDKKYEELPIINYEEQHEFIDKVVQGLHEIILKHVQYVSVLYMFQPSPKLRWLMTIQALRFLTNEQVNKGVNNGEYLNTYSYANLENVLLEKLAKTFNEKRKMSWYTVLEDKRALLTAKMMALTNTLSFAGRLKYVCGNRTWKIFDLLVKMLCNGYVDDIPIPDIKQKIEILLLGKFNGIEVFSFVWGECPREIARKFKIILGDDDFNRIELEMIKDGVIYEHVYREKYLNRHGHGESNPVWKCTNPKHTHGFVYPSGSNRFNGWKL